MLRTRTWTLLLMALAFLALPAHAQTPDGETPSVETVCDPLRNATPGLYGLCVAYCEAHDADLDPNTLEIGNMTIANENILENYNRRKTASDPEMPCLRVACPCFDAADLAELAAVSSNCVVSGDSIRLFGQSVLACKQKRDFGAALVNTRSGGLSCMYQEVDEATCQVLSSTSIGTTLDEFTACRDLLAAEVSRLEIVCLNADF